MWNRLKNHLIWTPEDFSFIRQSWTKIELADWNRPSGLLIPPERIKFLVSDQWRRGQLRSTSFWFKLRTSLLQIQKTFFSYFQTHFSLSIFTIHHLSHSSSSLISLYTHLLFIWSPDSESSRLGALGSTLRSKLLAGGIFGLPKSQSSNQAFSYLYVEGRDLLNLFVKLLF